MSYRIILKLSNEETDITDVIDDIGYDENINIGILFHNLDSD